MNWFWNNIQKTLYKTVLILVKKIILVKLTKRLLILLYSIVIILNNHMFFPNSKKGLKSLETKFINLVFPDKSLQNLKEEWNLKILVCNPSNKQILLITL